MVLLVRVLPLFFGIAVALVWLSVPQGVWSGLIGEMLREPTATNLTELPTPHAPADIARAYFGSTDSASAESVASLERFTRATSSSWRATVAGGDRLFAAPDTVTIVPLAIPATSNAFSALSAFEKSDRARVWAWVLQPFAEPELAATATPDSTLLYSADELASAQATDEASLLWRTWHVPGMREAVDWTSLPGHFVSSQDATRDIGVNVVTDARRWWVVYVLAKHSETSALTNTQLPDSLASVAPSSTSWRQSAQTVAADRGIDLVVVGPLQLDAVPLRMPSGSSFETARTLGAAIWPGQQALFLGDTPALSQLSSHEASLAGAPWGAVRMEGVYRSDAGSDQLFGDSVMYLAAYEAPPGVTAAGALSQQYRSAVIALAPGLVPALIVAVALFVVSALVALGSLILEDGGV